MALTDRQRRFAAEYLIDLNASAAYQRAGYKATGNAAEASASQLLRNPKVAALIQTGLAARQGRTEIKADAVLREIHHLAASDIGEILDFSGDDPQLRPAHTIPEAARRCIASVKVRRYVEGKGDAAKTVEVTEFKLWDKLGALDKLARHLGLLKDTLVLEGAEAPVRVLVVGHAEDNLRTGAAQRGDGPPV